MPVSDQQLEEDALQCYRRMKLVRQLELSALREDLERKLSGSVTSEQMESLIQQSQESYFSTQLQDDPYKF